MVVPAAPAMRDRHPPQAASLWTPQTPGQPHQRAPDPHIFPLARPGPPFASQESPRPPNGLPGEPRTPICLPADAQRPAWPCCSAPDPCIVPPGKPKTPRQRPWKAPGKLLSQPRTPTWPHQRAPGSLPRMPQTPKPPEPWTPRQPTPAPQAAHHHMGPANPSGVVVVVGGLACQRARAGANWQ